MPLLAICAPKHNHVYLQRQNFWPHVRGCNSVEFVAALSCSINCFKDIRHGTSTKYNLLPYKSFNIQIKTKSFLCNEELEVPNLLFSLSFKLDQRITCKYSAFSILLVRRKLRLWPNDSLFHSIFYSTKNRGKNRAVWPPC